MKYPIILLFRYDKYSTIDNFIQVNQNELMCSITVTNDALDMNKMFDSNNHLLLTFGPNDQEYNDIINSILPDRIKLRWIHMNDISTVDHFNKIVNYLYINNATSEHLVNRPVFSLFTTCYNSYDKIFRAYNSIKLQILKDWEWVILDDSPEDDHFQFLKTVFKNDKRIRLYKRSENSGSIGNVKNEAVMLCRGKYVLEMDHDDEILPDTLSDAATVFDNDTEIGFIYMDFVNLYENGDNFSYGDFFGLGYSGYYCQKYKNKWINVAVSPNINNISLSHIVAIPNHPRIWRKSSLMDMGNYSEFLPVSDDYELILRTSVKTKMAKIAKLGYIQYMNNNNNNFSLIRNSEINRLCKYHLKPQCFEKYRINERMRELGAFEDPIHASAFTQIWKRKDYEYKYCNKIYNVNFKKQYCIIGLNTFKNNKNMILELYENKENDFLLLDSENKIDVLTRELDYHNLDNIKCYSLENHSEEELVNYFMLIYKSCPDYRIITSSTGKNYWITNKLENTNSTTNKEILTIITPCVRPENLKKLKDSINFHYVKEWIIVYDGKHISSIPDTFEKNDKIKEYIFKGEGISGNPQRNFALDIIDTLDTYIYFLDDDNIIHPDIYDFLNNIEPEKMYTFNQSRPKNVYPYKSLLKGDNIEIFNIDTAMLLINYNLCKDIRWIPDKYNADGFFIKECYESNADKWVFVDKTLSYYNKLV